MEEQLIETWNIHNGINLYLLGEIALEALAPNAGGKGRGAGEMFGHMHNVRLMWLKEAAPDLLDGLEKVEKEAAADKEQLRDALVGSGKAVAELLSRSIANGGKVRGFKPHVTAFLGYLISHESYHRGEMGIVVAQAGHKLESKVAYGIWEWGRDWNKYTE